MCGIFGYLSSNINNFYTEIINSGYKIKERGPESTQIINTKDYILMFHRLSIMNPIRYLDQPFVYLSRFPSSNLKEVYYIMCNGEIYNYKDLMKEYNIQLEKEHNDISIIFPLFESLNYNFTHLNRLLNGEYSLTIIKVIYERDGTERLDTVYMSTDPCSVRPLFYCINPETNVVCFSSLLKGLTDLPNINKKLITRMDGGDIVIVKFKNGVIDSEFQTVYNFDYNLSGLMKPLCEDNELYKRIYETLKECVVKRLDSDRPLGCLLSGGLDSSLVAAIASEELKKRGQKLYTFSIGMIGGTDLEFAKKVSKHIGSEHTEVIFTEEEGLSVIKDVVKTCESYDITTIRASIPQYLLAKYIREKTEIKVVLNGDGSDECWGGYLYNYMAPSVLEFHKDNMKLIDNIHYFDGLRVDRNISRWGLEARVPFLDWDLVKLSKMVSPSVKKPTLERMEKYVLRKSVEESNKELLPMDILWRKKEAFSDGVSPNPKRCLGAPSGSETSFPIRIEKSWYQVIQEYIERVYDEEKIENPQFSREEYLYNKPISKESEYYRRVFSREFTNEVERVIPYYWMPNWNTDVKDPSARKLNVYS